MNYPFKYYLLLGLYCAVKKVVRKQNEYRKNKSMSNPYINFFQCGKIKPA